MSKSEVECPVAKKPGAGEIQSLSKKTELRENVKGGDAGIENEGKRKRRTKLEGLRKAVEKSRAGKATASFDLTDLMKVD